MTRVLRFYIKLSHPDWTMGRDQAVECRRLYNSLNAVAREASTYRHDSTSDTHISKELGLLDFIHSKPPLASAYGYEPIRKRAVALSWKSFYVLRKNGRKTGRQ